MSKVTYRELTENYISTKSEQDYKALESSIDSTASAFVTKHFSDWDYRSETDVLSTCLNFRNSKKLDSMAMSLYRKYKIRYRQKHQFD